MKHINRNGRNAFVMNAGTGIAPSMQIGSKNNRIISLILQDDAARFITRYGVFKHATSKNNTLQALSTAIRIYGIPQQIITDHGTQDMSLARDSCHTPQCNKNSPKTLVFIKLKAG